MNILDRTNIKWITPVPKRWEVWRTRFVGNIVSGSTPKTSNPANWDGGILWVTPVDFGNDDHYLVTESRRTITKAGVIDANLKLVPTNSIVISTRAPVGLVAKAGQDLTINQGCKAIIANELFDPDFLYFYFKVISEPLESTGNTTVFSELSLGHLKDFPIPKPPLLEQQKISAYLTLKTSQIDRFITNRKEQIGLLNEQANKVLEDLLVEGVGSHEKREIDFPYLKQLPSSWEFMKLNHLANITRLAGYEYTLLWKIDENGEITALRGQNVGFNCLLDIENADRISDKLSKRLNRSRLYKNDIVFPCVGTVGKAVLIEENNKYHINQNIAKITPSEKINPLYLTYILNSYFCYHQIIHFNTSDAQPNVLVRDLRRFMIPVPPLDEQNEIVKEINDRRKTHIELTLKYQKQIDLMQEYKTALISKAVTGKIDVREWQPKKKLQEFTA